MMADSDNTSPLDEPMITDARSGDNDSSESEEEDLFAALKRPHTSTDDPTAATNSVANKRLKSAHKSKSRKGKSQPRILACDECLPKRYFRKTRVLDRHKEVTHGSQAKFEVCMWCAKNFATRYQLSIHQKLYFHDKPLV